MNLVKLEKFLRDSGQPKFRLEQIKKAIYEDGASSFLEISTIPKDLRELLNKEMKILSFEVEKILVSKDKRSIKALLKISCHSERRAKDPEYYRIETVLLSPKPGVWTACISSQSGCPLGCAFCATGKGGFKRDFTAEEITDQILFWKTYIRNIKNSTISNIVYMGMGEPLLNWENVKKSLDDFTNPKLLNFGSRSISISTVGVKGGIEKYLEDFPQVNLAISLHFADSVMRSKYMPANRTYDLENIRKDLKKYFEKSKRKIFIEYIMFEGINDGLEDARKLEEYLKSIGNFYLLHVNLISYNSEHKKCDKSLFKASPKEKILKFRNYLLRNNINTTIRKSLGSEIQGACGQLAGS